MSETRDGGVGKWGSRVVVALVVGVVAMGVAAWYSGLFWVHVMVGLAVDGLIAWAWVGAGGLVGSMVVRRVTGGGDLGFLVFTAMGLGLGVVSLVVLGLGLAGSMNGVVAWGILGVGWMVGVVDWVWRKGPHPGPLPEYRERGMLVAHGKWLWVLTAPFLGIAIVGVSLLPALLWRPWDPHPYDVMTYHLQVPREWYEAGRIVPLRHNVYSYFPFGMEMHYLLAMNLRGGPWKGMYLAQIMSLVHMALAVGAVVSLVGGVRKNVGHIAGVAMTVTPWVVMVGAIAYNESGMLFYEVLAVGWIMRAMGKWGGGEVGGREMAMGGVMAGFACGVKYTGMPIVLVGLPVAGVAAIAMANWRRIGKALAGCAIYVVLGLAVFSPWLIRNTAWAGNPVFPLGMRVLGRAHFTEVQVERFERAHRARPEQASVGGRAKALWKEVAADWRMGWVILPLAAVAVAIGWRNPEVRFLGIVLAGVAVFWMGLTHLMGRFFAPAVPIVAMLIGLGAVGRLRKVMIGGVIIAAIFAFAGTPGVGGQGKARGLHGALSAAIAPPHDILFRMEDTRKLGLPEGLVASGKKLFLIGDAEGFYREMPMSRLEYRTIFDVVERPGKSIVDSWLGRDLSELRKEGWVELNPGELRRLARTYHGVGEVPEQWNREGDETVVLPPVK